MKEEHFLRQDDWDGTSAQYEGTRREGATSDNSESAQESDSSLVWRLLNISCSPDRCGVAFSGFFFKEFLSCFVFFSLTNVRGAPVLFEWQHVQLPDDPEKGFVERRGQVGDGAEK
ncbi:hypothetical protein TNCV_2423261 [Trichonephila clavipes]|nr:hypothetical protein TNCV_2423261 [Trichonephila clavipes]